jgi:hypothetical protein
MIVVSAGRGPDNGAGRLIEDQFARIILIVVVEVEHVFERAGDGVK